MKATIPEPEAKEPLTREKIKAETSKLQEQCGELTGHDPGSDDMELFGYWHMRESKYASGDKVKVGMRRCRYCGYTVFAYRQQSACQRWKEGEPPGHYVVPLR